MQTNNYQIEIITWKHKMVYTLLVLHRNTWKHRTVCKLFVLDKNT